MRRCIKNNTEEQSQVSLRIGLLERQQCLFFKAEEDIQACLSMHGKQHIYRINLIYDMIYALR